MSLTVYVYWRVQSNRPAFLSWLVIYLPAHRSMCCSNVSIYRSIHCTSKYSRFDWPWRWYHLDCSLKISPIFTLLNEYTFIFILPRIKTARRNLRCSAFHIAIVRHSVHLDHCEGPQKSRSNCNSVWVGIVTQSTGDPWPLFLNKQKCYGS